MNDDSGQPANFSRSHSGSLPVWLKNPLVQTCLVAFLLLLAVVLAYQPAWHGSFLWDDDAYVIDNNLLTAPDGLWRTWFSLDSPSQYFPLTYTTFRFERNLWGLNPTGYHWVNLLLHTANALLVWRVLRRLAIPGAVLAAALFALHPVQVESVAWITERKNVLSLFFSLWAVLAWLKFANSKPKPAWDFYALALLCYTLALFAKTTACTLPATLILVLWLKERPLGWVRWAQVLPFVILGLAAGVVAMWWERFHQGTQGEVFHLGLLDRALLAGRAVWFYAGKLVWPANLMFSYPRWAISTSSLLAYSWPMASVALAVLVFLLRPGLGRGPEVALTFYVATLSPLLGFIMLYTFHYTFVADHYQYVACIGPLALAAAVLTRMAGFLALRPLSAYVLSTCLVLTLAFLTWRQSAAYASAETLWRTTLARNPDSLLARYQLGNTLVRTGRLDEGISYYETFLAREPGDPDVHFNLANTLLRRGRPDDAITHYQSAVAIRPRDPEYRCNLGSALVQAGRKDEAVTQFMAALEIRPGMPIACNNLGFIVWTLATSPEPSRRNLSHAIRVGEQASKLSGDGNPMLFRNLAVAYAEAGRTKEALNTARRGLQLAAAQTNAALANALQQQIQVYQSRIPSPTNSP